MLSISDDGNVNIDDAKVTKYVQQLASKYNTFGRKRSFKTSSGDTIEIGGGDYGWVVSKKNEKAQLLSDLEEANQWKESLFTSRQHSTEALTT